jgi:hypothetical protein
MTNGEQDYQDWAHGLTEKIHAIEEEKATTTLTSKLFDITTSFYQEHRDDNGYLTFKDDDQKKQLSDSLWEEAAMHVAKTYLKMDDGVIASLKALPEVDGINQFDTMIANYLGINKTQFFERIKGLKHLRPENLVQNYVLPLVGAHVQTRKVNMYTAHVDTLEKAQDMHKYIADAITHNPDTFKGIEPPGFEGRDTTAKIYFENIVDKIPKTYHPKKKDTHQKG